MFEKFVDFAMERGKGRLSEEKVGLEREYCMYLLEIMAETKLKGEMKIRKHNGVQVFWFILGDS